MVEEIREPPASCIEVRDWSRRRPVGLEKFSIFHRHFFGKFTYTHGRACILLQAADFQSLTLHSTNMASENGAFIVDLPVKDCDFP